MDRLHHTRCQATHTMTLRSGLCPDQCRVIQPNMETTLDIQNWLMQILPALILTATQFLPSSSQWHLNTLQKSDILFVKCIRNVAVALNSMKIFTESLLSPGAGMKS